MAQRISNVPTHSAFALDYGLAVQDLSERVWVPYDSSGLFYGIGLMCNGDSAAPELDAVTIRQTLSRRPRSSGMEKLQRLQHFIGGKDCYIENFLSRLPIRPTKAKLSKLEPGAVIPPHIDMGCEGTVRVHWVLQCDGRNLFRVKEDQKLKSAEYSLERGDLFLFDPTKVHSVRYLGSSISRIHLVANFMCSTEEMQKIMGI